MRRLLLALVALPLAVSFAPGQSADPAKLAAITARMQKFADDGELAGAVTVVGRKAGILHHEAVGFRSIEDRAPMTRDSVFRIASMSKPVAAIAVMILADEGKLSPDDPMEKHLPEFKGQMLVTGRDGETLTLKKPKRPVTIRDVMTHTSGLSGSYGPGFGDAWTTRPWSLTETTIAVASRPLEFEPGSKWAYCNTGIDSLGRLVERVSGRRFEDFCRDRIFAPLGMWDTTFHPSPEQLARTAVTYGLDKSNRLTPTTGLLIEYHPGARHPVPMGGLFSTGGDLARLYRMMLNKGALNGRRVLSEKAVAEMTKVQTGDLRTGFVDGMGFGYGWAVVREPKGVTGMLTAGTFGHGGAFGTQGWVDPNQDLFCVLLIQRTGIPNGDASPYRHALQGLAVDALKP